MVYDIVYENRICGRLEAEREGLMTVFRAECEYAEGILRLYLCGNDTVSLGVMRPEGGRLRLCRRLSRLEAEKLPEIRRVVLSHAPPEVEIPAAQEVEWRVCTDGTLLSDSYIALPAELRRSVPGLRRKIIDGREYILFRY